MKDLFTGEKVHLVAIDPEIYSKASAVWSRSSLFDRLCDSSPARPYSAKKTQQWFEESLEKNADFMPFAIHALAEDRLIGFIELDSFSTPNTHGDAFVGIGIGEPEFWGGGYGSDAMQLILQYAFTEMNLERVSLNVFEYNPRAIRSYEKVGFVHEGRERMAVERDGRRWDVIYMGILRTEWLERSREDKRNE